MSPTHAELQGSPDPSHLTAIAELVAPGSTPVSVTRLTGGLDNGMHVLELQSAARTRRKVVLRRTGGSEESLRDRVTREWRALKLLKDLGIPAPAPIALDETGSVAGSPAMVTSFEEGQPLLQPGGVVGWAGQVADVLWKLHSAELKFADTGFLGPVKGIAEVAAEQVADERRFAGHPLGARLRRSVQETLIDAIEAPAAVVHGDFWPGNILWSDGKLLAIVDWSDVRLSDPALDVGYMWMDLSIIGEHDAASEFVRKYESLSGQPVRNLKLAISLALGRALPDPGRWMPSWVGSGRAELRVEDVRRNFSDVIKRLTA